MTHYPNITNLLNNTFLAANLTLTPQELNAFTKLHQLLVAKNENRDLTRVHGERNLILKHYVDGALAAEMIKPCGLTMDLGTGAGFPGLPIAIRRPHWPLLLAEPRGRRLAFMEEVVNLLGLNNVEFYPHKVGPRFDRAICNFITRDFESAVASLTRAQEIIPPGGRVYLMKGPGVDAELAEAQEHPAWLEFEIEDDRAYDFDNGRIRRRLITWRKKDGTKKPRQIYNQPVVEIASRENLRYKSWLKSLSGRGLKKNSVALISGRKFISEIISRFPDQVAGVIARRKDELEGLLLPPTTTVYLVRPEIFAPLDTTGAGSPLLLLNIPNWPIWPGELAPGLTLFLPFQDPANLGAAIRTATALGARVVLLAEATNPWHPKSLRAAGPALLQAEIYQGPSLKELATKNICGINALSPVGSDFLSADLPENCGLVFGLEGPGLGDVWPAEKCLAIPMAPGVESLNAAATVAVCLGICLKLRK